jgi:hypothetical protein
MQNYNYTKLCQCGDKNNKDSINSLIKASENFDDAFLLTLEIVEDKTAACES